MYMQQNKADIFQKAGATLADAPSSKCLGIRFSPDVAFAVTCKRAETKAAAKHQAGSRITLTGTYGLIASVRHSIAVLLRNVGASGPS